MKDKINGFTLIELLAVVVLLGIVGLIVTINFSNTLNSNNQKRCDSFVKEVENAGCVYATLNDQEISCNRDNCVIPLRILISRGLINSDSDACTNKDIKEQETVTVTWNTFGEKKCVYSGVKEYEG